MHPEYIEESDFWLREAGFVNKATGWAEEPEQTGLSSTEVWQKKEGCY